MTTLPFNLAQEGRLFYSNDLQQRGAFSLGDRHICVYPLRIMPFSLDQTVDDLFQKPCLNIFLLFTPPFFTFEYCSFALLCFFFFLFLFSDLRGRLFTFLIPLCSYYDII